MENKDFIDIKIDIAELKKDVKYIKQSLSRIENNKCREITTIHNNRDKIKNLKIILTFFGSVLVAIIGFISSLKIKGF